MQLTATQERYLRVIYELNIGDRGAMLTQIAANAGVSKASACVAVDWLEKSGLAQRQARKRVFLTSTGVRLAVLSYGKHEILVRFFTEVLGVDADTAERDAAAMEPLISTATLCALCRHVHADGCMGCAQGTRQPDGNACRPAKDPPSTAAQ